MSQVLITNIFDFKVIDAQVELYWAWNVLPEAWSVEYLFWARRSLRSLFDRMLACAGNL